MWSFLEHKGGETQIGISQKTNAKIIRWNQELGSQELGEFACSFTPFHVVAAAAASLSCSPFF